MAKATILAVDDNPINLRVLFGVLSEADYKILVAKNAMRALDQAKRSKPDLILLDVMMPEIDGFETCRRLKNDPETQEIPVIFMTALVDIQSILTGFEVGGTDYITKPIHHQEVLARINTHLSNYRLQRELQHKNEELEEALARVKQLEGLLPICANCKKVRDDQGYWHKIETYITQNSLARFTHGLCPHCATDLYPEIFNESDEETGHWV